MVLDVCIVASVIYIYSNAFVIKSCSLERETISFMVIPPSYHRSHHTKRPLIFSHSLITMQRYDHRSHNHQVCTFFFLLLSIFISYSLLLQNSIIIISAMRKCIKKLLLFVFRQKERIYHKHVIHTF